MRVLGVIELSCCFFPPVFNTAQSLLHPPMSLRLQYRQPMLASLTRLVGSVTVGSTILDAHLVFFFFGPLPSIRPPSPYMGMLAVIEHPYILDMCAHLMLCVSLDMPV